MYEFQLSTFDIDVHRLLIYRQKSAIYGVFLSTYVVNFPHFFCRFPFIDELLLTVDRNTQ